MNLQYAKDPRWANANHTAVDLTIKWDNWPEELPFTASPDDVEPHGRQLFDAAAKGQFGEIAPFVPPEPEGGGIPVTEFDDAPAA